MVENHLAEIALPISDEEIRHFVSQLNMHLNYS